MNQYRIEVDKESGRILSCMRAYRVADDGVLDADTRIIIRRHTETEAEARALAMYIWYSYTRGGM